MEEDLLQLHTFPESPDAQNPLPYTTMARSEEPTPSPHSDAGVMQHLLLHPTAKVRPPTFCKSKSFNSFVNRFNDWANLFKNKPHYLRFLSLIEDDNTYNRLHSIPIPPSMSHNPTYYTALYLKAIQPSHNEIQQKLLNTKQSADESMKDYSERIR